jgi:hypothetical protein
VQFYEVGECSRLATRYCGPSKILERIGPITYMLSFPASLCIHNVFHVSLLKTYVHDDNHIIDWNVIWVERKGVFQVWSVLENQTTP